MEYKVIEYIDPRQLAADTTVNMLDINGELMKQASLFAHYGILAAKAQQQSDNFKIILEAVEAKLDKAIRDKAAAGGVKMTEAQIAKEICRSPDYVKVVRLLNEAKMFSDLGKASMEALRHKRDALVQMAFNAREEAKGEMRIMERNEDALRSRRKEFQERMRKELAEDDDQ